MGNYTRSISISDRHDAHLIKLIAAEQERRGDRTVTKTAKDLLLERLTSIESSRNSDVIETGDPARTKTVHEARS